jgi:hypothetical protein
MTEQHGRKRRISVSGTSAPTPERTAYLRGQRYREQLLAIGQPVLREARRTNLMQAIRLLPFSVSDPGSRIADALAKECGIDRRTIQRDARYAAAVDTIALNCGKQVLPLLLGGHPLLSCKLTEQISRTAPPRQRYEMEQLAQGRRPLQRAAPVFDTTDFGEVISRLRRAEGKVRMALRTLRDGQAAAAQTSGERALLVHNVRVMIDEANELARMVRDAAEDQPDEHDHHTPRRQAPVIESTKGVVRTPVSHGVTGRLLQARSFIRKCVRDLPTLLIEVRPLRREKEEIEERLKRIVTDCFAIVTETRQSETESDSDMK